MRYIMIDRIDEIRKFDYATGVKAISFSDDCFEHHFPGHPVYPGALLSESMAQLGGALLELSLRDDVTEPPRCLVSSVKVKYRRFVLPGDLLRMRAEILSRHEDSAKVRVLTTAGGEAVCEAEFIFLFLWIGDPRLDEERRRLMDQLTRQARFVE